MNDNELRNQRLVALSELKDYEVAKNNTDVTGWRVVGADGEKLGDVKDLIVDMDAMKVRYLSVLGDNRFFNRDRDTYMLIPIGAAALDRKGKNIFVASVDANTISRYPAYGGGPITPDYEYAVRDNFRRAHHEAFGDKTEYKSEFDDALQRDATTTRRINQDFYNDESFNEDRFYTATEPVYDRDASVQRTTDSLETRDHRTKPVEDSIATIERLENLRKRGSITEEEFNLLKRRALES